VRFTPATAGRKSAALTVASTDAFSPIREIPLSGAGEVEGLGGDVNGDAAVTLQDAFYLINFLFGGGSPPRGPSDVNGDGSADAQDVAYLAAFLLEGGPAPR
jgi:hypothetical protein